jgi:hypothetical protein
MDETVLRMVVTDLNLEALRKGFKITLSTEGWSMLPLLRPDDRIEVIRCDEPQLRNGDLVVFQTAKDPGRIVVHRLVKRVKGDDGYMFLTKGDCVADYDPTVPERNVLGKVMKIKKRHFELPLDSFLGRAINLFMLSMSLAGFFFVGHRIFKTAQKVLFRSSKAV